MAGATSWLWEFGDGATSTQQNTSHTYSDEGSYDVRLTVTGANGVVTVLKADYITVGNFVTGGLTATYFDNIDLSGPSITRVDPTIDFDLGTGSPDPQIGPNTFSARWTGKVVPQFSQTYTFTTESDDGVRLFINDQPLIDNWTDHGPTLDSGSIALMAGQSYDVRMEFYENGGGALARLFWESPSQPQEIVPANRLQHIVIPPEGPNDLLATPVSDTKVSLEWENDPTTETGFRVERSLNGTTGWTAIGTTAADIAIFDDRNLQPATQYYYRVFAFNGDGDSRPSNLISATTLATSNLTASINFQLATAPTFAGYLVDSGTVFANRGNGFSYGWNAATTQTRDRNSPNAPDQRFDTLIHMQRDPNPNASWELAVPRGVYQVHLVAGDPTNDFNANYRINMEGDIGNPGCAIRQSALLRHHNAGHRPRRPVDDFQCCRKCDQQDQLHRRRSLADNPRLERQRHLLHSNEPIRQRRRSIRYQLADGDSVLTAPLAR